MKKGTKKKGIALHTIIEIVLIIVAVIGIFTYFVHRRAVNNNAAPVITIEAQSNEFSVKDSVDDLLKGVKAVDKEDGIVTESVIIESISQIIDGNKRTITYVAFDSDNNVTKYDRDIVYTDYVSPTFTSPKQIKVKVGTSSEILSKLSATDVIDGDISDQIKLEVNNVNAGVPGEYSVKISVTNSCGDVSNENIVVAVVGEEVQ